jgi:hypothetical protein
VARPDRTRALANAVAAAFESAGYSPAELLQGPIRITDLSWQAPPLRCRETLGGIELDHYLSYPLPVGKAEDLFEFYKLTLFRLSFAPEEAVGPEGYRHTGALMPGAWPGERKFAFAKPDPEGLSTGVMFALEMAVLFNRSYGLQQLDDDADSYAAHTGGMVVGVRQGKVTECTDLWDVDCSGTVQGLLEQPRGAVTVDCLYDTIARLRSALHEEPARFAEFMGLDYALQALRILADGGISRSLQTAIQQMSLESFKRKQKIASYTQAIEVMESWSYPDRTKLSMLLEILVPTCLNFGNFCRKIYNPSRAAPAVLQGKTEQRILTTLKHEREKLQLAVRAANPNQEQPK